MKKLFLTVTILLTICGCAKQNLVTEAKLIIYGKEVLSYEIKDEEKITELIKILDGYICKDNYQGKEKDIELPKGNTCEIILNNNNEYKFIGEYIIYDHKVYKTTSYEMIINDFNDIFNVGN